MNASLRPLRIAVLGDHDSIHTQRWLRAFAERGHEMHAISYYRPQAELPGITLHVLQGADGGVAQMPGSARSVLRSKLPPSLLRPLHALRYSKAGLKETLAWIKPDVFQAHYLVEYGFYGALAGFHPYVVTAWGSDVYVAPRNPLTNLIARWTLRRADLVTASDSAMLEAVLKLGAKLDRSQLVRIGALEELFFEEKPVSVNLEPDASPPTVISTRALEPLYNVDTILLAYARVRNRVPGTRLQVAHEGSERAKLEALAAELGLGDAVQFLGQLTPEEIRDALSAAQVYVSVPDSDSMAASTIEAMARGCFPVVSDLPSQDGFIEHGVSGLRVTAGDVETLANALQRALVDADLRRKAALVNRKKVEAEARLSTQVDRLEATFRELGHQTHP